MALPNPYIDGFEEYPDPNTPGVGVASVWHLGQSGRQLTDGRFTGKSLRQWGPATDRTFLAVNPDDSMVAGLAYFTPEISTATRSILAFANGPLRHFHIDLTPDRFIILYGPNDELLAQLPLGFQLSTWHYFACAARIHPTAGEIKIYRDGELIIALS